MISTMNVKRQKTINVSRPLDGTGASSSIETQVAPIEYNPEIDYLFSTNENQLHFCYYNAPERIHGRTMEEWLRPSIALNMWYPKSSSAVRSFERCRAYVKIHFEICKKLGLKFWSGYINNFLGFADTYDDCQNVYEQSLKLFQEHQQKCGLKPLWIGIKFNDHPNGVITNPVANVIAQAGAQVKRALDMAHKLNSDNFVINIEQEVYEHPICTDFRREMKHQARFLKLIVEYRDKIGYRGQLIIDSTGKRENKDNENQYVRGCTGVLAFLKHFNQDCYFKVSVNPGHDFNLAYMYDGIGTIEVFKDTHYEALMLTSLFKTILEAGGLNQGGVTFHLPCVQKQCDPKELLDVYICAIDAFAKALRCAAKLVIDTQFNKQLQLSYQSFLSGWGAKFISPDATLEDCEEFGRNVEKAKISRNWAFVLHKFLDVALK